MEWIYTILCQILEEQSTKVWIVAVSCMAVIATTKQSGEVGGDVKLKAQIGGQKSMSGRSIVTLLKGLKKKMLLWFLSLDNINNQPSLEQMVLTLEEGSHVVLTVYFSLYCGLIRLHVLFPVASKRRHVDPNKRPL